VAEGATTSLKGLTKQHIADFVHGTDGFGNTSQAAVEVRARAELHPGPCVPSCAAPPACGERSAASVLNAARSRVEPQGRTVGVSAAEWLVEQVTASPGQVSVLALGPLTNIALALQLNERVTRDLVRPRPRPPPCLQPVCSGAKPAPSAWHLTLAMGAGRACDPGRRILCERQCQPCRCGFPTHQPACPACLATGARLKARGALRSGSQHLQR
jgi:hypothetical protein